MTPFSPASAMSNLTTRLRQSRLAHDSLWAVFGNGLGYGLLLLAGIFIARRLGNDIYGEYGLVKTTMIYIAGFATFGLGISSTKYIANALSADPASVRSLARDAIQITLCFSLALAIALAAAAAPIASLLDTPSLTGTFRVLAAIIVLKALNTTQNGVLAGFGDFRHIAANSVASGALMLISCIPLTIFFGLDGAFASLLASQALNTLLNQMSLHKRLRGIKVQDHTETSYKRELIRFSFPIALQELNYTICSWGGIALLTRLSSVGQVGIYTAVAQWNGVITFIPGLLYNVILSHLSGTANDPKSHRRTLKTMLGVNFISTLFPFIVVFALAGWIAGFYGPTFNGMADVLRIMTFATIFSACSTVLYSELISRGHNWLSFSCRIVQEGTLFLVGWILLLHWTSQSGAICFATAYLTSAIISFLAPFTCLTICKGKN